MRRRLSRAQISHIVTGPCRPPIPEMTNPGELAERAYKEIVHRGFRVRFKAIQARSDPHRLVKNWATSTSVLGKRVFLGLGFRVRNLSEQAITLWHEMVHCEQVRAYGMLFHLRYIQPSWRATYEAEARVSEIVVWQKLNGLMLDEGRLREMVSAMHGFYRLERLDRDFFIDDVAGAIRAALVILRLNFSSTCIN